jgi:NAD(P)-dependent dehydrogenase (short-subunit alcohol dehydrogenase family)
MAYELEPLGIKIVLIEPWFIKTNVVNAIVVAKKARDPGSPYSQMMQKLEVTSSEILTPVNAVSKVILEAVTSKNPNLRYLAGKDIETLVANKKTMNDTEFHNMIEHLPR